MRDSHRNLLVGDQIFQLQLGALVHQLGAPRVAVKLLDLFQLFDNYAAQLLFRGQNRFILGDVLADLRELLQQLVDRELRQSVELQFEHGIDLPVAHPRNDVQIGRVLIEIDDDLFTQRPGPKILARLGPAPRPTNNLDHAVEVIESNLVALKYVLPLPRLAQQV